MSFQTCKTLFLLRNTTEDILKKCFCLYNESQWGLKHYFWVNSPLKHSRLWHEIQRHSLGHNHSEFIQVFFFNKFWQVRTITTETLGHFEDKDLCFIFDLLPSTNEPHIKASRFHKWTIWLVNDSSSFPFLFNKPISILKTERQSLFPHHSHLKWHYFIYI